MSLRTPLIPILVLLAGAADALAGAAHAFSGYGPGGTLYVNVLPHRAEVTLDGKRIGVANDLQAALLVDTRAGTHRLTASAPGYETVTLPVQVVRAWTTRVRLTLIPVR
jgi:hypothetical protein